MSVGIEFKFNAHHTNCPCRLQKALEAYQKRDGATVLKEVKMRWIKGMDDGLQYFLFATAPALHDKEFFSDVGYEKDDRNLQHFQPRY